MSTPFYSAAAFDDSWIRGVQLAGPRFFHASNNGGSGTNKWDFCPSFDRIRDELAVLSTGEGVFLAAMYSFFDANAGADLLAMVGANSPGAVSAALDEKRRRIIADLTVSYAGW